MKNCRNIPEGVDPDKFINDRFDEAVALDEYKRRMRRTDESWEEGRMKDFTESIKIFGKAYGVLLADNEFREMLMKSSRSTRTCARKMIQGDLWDRLIKFRNGLRGRI